MQTSNYPNAQFLAEADWLHANIDAADLRIIDARYDVQAHADGRFEEVSGHADYLAGHIPGAQFVDLRDDLTATADPTSIIGPQEFAALMSRLGIGPRSTVAIYDAHGGVWAARLWWALRYYGHDDVRLLHGGLHGWTAAGYELQVNIVAPPPAEFVASPRPHLRVTRQDVLQAMDNPAVRIVDALPEPFYLGMASLFPHCRKGHVPGARNVPAENNLQPHDARIRPMDALRQLWQVVDIEPGKTVITYCGSGMYAAFDLFVLMLMGHEEVALYDASWMEWGADDRLPVETILQGD